MTAVRNVAIAGAGIAGLTAAILLAEEGVEVDVYDPKPELTALGSGITLQGNILRILDQLGVWTKAREQSYPFETLGLRAPGPDATVIAEIPDAKTGGPDYPATVGMYRPDLAKLLLDRAIEVGARVNFGVGVASIDQDDDGVSIGLADGRTVRADLLIGADGLHSTVRSLIGIDVEPKHTGMGIWRAFVPRPAEVTHTDLYYGGPAYIAGYCPTSEDMMYAYLVEDAQDRSGLSADEQVEVMRGLSMAYGGPWNAIRDSLGGDSRVNYTWFTSHVVGAPWNRGRVVIIGDAAHSCPPTVAQGAAQAAEDAVVLSELLAARDSVDQGLWDEFHARRVERAREVVAASVQLGQWMLDHEQGDVPGLMRGVAVLVSQPA